ncbi:hypothetical protein SAMN05216226_11377 [Halovenus aranensis]|jgi:putative phosphoesterase|uniref:Phosphoesterase n=1 Tax=Halovenus aranensis TaxID=890420 RepID=A0A1G8Y563_9EURY|nr:metallophosphoesterase [Halovenus aranensis]SDJ97777.1 hypothetical protein SAMN05216226_11377 [Halovenus aranensis]
MLVVLSDTHSQGEMRLTETVADAIDSATVVVHAGDFTTAETLRNFERRAEKLVAVSGNSDSRTVTERLPTTRTFGFGGRQFVVTHGHRHDRTSLSLLARQEGADVAIVGHTHRAEIDHVGETVVVNGGSHADPRGGEPTFAVIEQTGANLRVTIQTAEGHTRERELL